MGLFTSTSKSLEYSLGRLCSSRLVEVGKSTSMRAVFLKTGLYDMSML